MNFQFQFHFLTHLYKVCFSIVPFDRSEVEMIVLSSSIVTVNEGLPGVLGNKGTLAKYRREQGNISQFLGTG